MAAGSGFAAVSLVSSVHAPKNSSTYARSIVRAASIGYVRTARFSVLQLEAPIHSPIQGHDCSDSSR